MQQNLFKPEAAKKAAATDLRDAFIGFGILILFFAAVAYLAYRVADHDLYQTELNAKK